MNTTQPPAERLIDRIPKDPRPIKASAEALEELGKTILLTKEQMEILARMIDLKPSPQERLLAELGVYHGRRLAARMAIAVQEHRFNLAKERYIAEIEALYEARVAGRPSLEDEFNAAIAAAE